MENQRQDPVIVVERTERKRSKGLMAGVLGAALVAALGVGGTLAYLTYTTNQEKNSFTSNPNITADLLEPEWTQAAADTDKKSAPDNSDIPLEADNMIPGSEVAKNPFVVNTSVNGAKAWAGIKLQFEKWNGSGYVAMTDDEMNKVLKVYSLYATGETADPGIVPATGWTESAGDAADGARYFYYATALEAETADEFTGENDTDAYRNIPATKRTVALFDKVKFLETATQADIDALNEVLNPGGNTVDDPSWRVTVTGAVIGATGAASETAATFVTETAGVSWKGVLDAAAASAAGTGVRTPVVP